MAKRLQAAPAEFGEDTFVQCANCDYTANAEAVEIAAAMKEFLDNALKAAQAGAGR